MSSSLKIPVMQKIPVLKKLPVLKEAEPPQKIPVTKEEMAFHIGQCRENMLPCHLFFMDVLYESTYKLVLKQAVRYSHTCHKGEVEDLAQQCWMRIFNKLHLYNPAKSKFSTWLVTVSNSVLIKIYHKGQKQASKFVDIEEEGGLDENRVSGDNSISGALRDDFESAINDLKNEYPEKVNIIEGLFRDESGNYREKVVYNRAAKFAGCSATKVSEFYREVVRPFFYNRFSEESYYE
jgi:RNA polymerase sigma factor (sigma-70 family)